MIEKVPINTCDSFSFIVNQENVLAWTTSFSDCTCCSYRTITILVRDDNSIYGLNCYAYHAKLICSYPEEHTIRCNCFDFTYNNVEPVLLDIDDDNGVLDVLNNPSIIDEYELQDREESLDYLKKYAEKYQEMKNKTNENNKLIYLL